MRRVAFILLAVLAAPAAARADVRLWQEEETVEVAGARPSSEPRHLDLFAFVQPTYGWFQGFEEREHRLLVRRARVGLAARLYPALTMRLDLDAAATPHVEDAYLDVELAAWLSLRLGRFEVPFLRSVQFFDAYEAFGQALPFTTGDLESAAFGSLRSVHLSDRDVGGMIHGGFGDPDFGPHLEYGVAIVAGATRFPFDRSDREGFMLAGRLEGHLFGVPIGDDAENDLAQNDRPHVSIGAGAIATCSGLGEFQRGFVVDAELRWEGLYVSASFLRLRSGVATGESTVGSLLGYDSEQACGEGPAGPTLPRFEHVALAAHAQAQYVLPPLLFPFEGQALEVLVRAAVVEPSDPPDGVFGGPADNLGPPNQWRLTAGLNWYPTREPIFRLSVSYELRVETETVVVLEERRDDIDDDVLWVQATAGL